MRRRWPGVRAPHLLALTTVAQANIFIECEVGIATLLHSLDVGSTDAMILESHELFDARVGIAKISDLFDETGRHAVIPHALQVFERQTLIAEVLQLDDEF